MVMAQERDRTVLGTAVAVGRVLKPHGLRGDIVFLPYVYDLTLLPDLLQRPVTLSQGHGPPQEHTVIAWRVAHKRILLRLHGCQNVQMAEALRNAEVSIPRAWFPPLPPGEYYWFEVEGLAVYTSDGAQLGTITEILHTGSNDVYIVRHASRETLIPALKDVVRTIDLARGEMHLYAAPGLFDV